MSTRKHHRSCGRPFSRIDFSVLRSSVSTKHYAIARIGLVYLNPRTNHRNPTNTIYHFSPDTSADEHTSLNTNTKADKDIAPDANADKDTAPHTDHYPNLNAN